MMLNGRYSSDDRELGLLHCRQPWKEAYLIGGVWYSEVCRDEGNVVVRWTGNISLIRRSDKELDVRRRVKKGVTRRGAYIENSKKSDRETEGMN